MFSNIFSHLVCSLDLFSSLVFSLLSSLFILALVCSLDLFSCLVFSSSVFSLFSLFFSLSLSLSLFLRVMLCVMLCCVVCVCRCVLCCVCGVVWHAENLRVYIQNVPVYAGTTRTFFSTCARGAGIHGDVFEWTHGGQGGVIVSSAYQHLPT